MARVYDRRSADLRRAPIRTRRSRQREYSAVPFEALASGHEEAPLLSDRSIGIIGAGPGGLAAAVLLAARGARVTIYEARDRVGGRCESVTLNGYRFDRGPTFFMMPYVLEEIFATAGDSMEKRLSLTRLDPMYRLVFSRGPGAAPMTIDATQDIAEMSRRISKIEPRDGPAFERFIRDNRVKLRLMEPILRRPIRNPTDLLRCGPPVDMLRVGAMLHPTMSVHQLLSRYFVNEDVRLAVSFQSKYLGMSPFDCPSLFTILPFIEYEYGIWHPRGGCNALMDALAQVAAQSGARIRLNTPVRAVEVRGSRATAVRLDDEVVDHDDVVVNADATWAIRNLLDAAVRARMSAEYHESAIESKRYSCSTFMLYLGLDGTVDLPHHTIVMSSRYRDNLQDITATGRITDDFSFYICNPSRTDPTMAPPGKSALYVLIPVANLRTSRGVVDWTTEAPALRRRVLDRLEREFGIAGVDRRIEAEQMFTPNDWEGCNITFGATFNLAHNLAQMLHRRPQNRLKGFDNLYLVGGGTHPGSGLPTIFLSAQIASTLIGQSARAGRTAAHASR